MSKVLSVRFETCCMFGSDLVRVKVLPGHTTITVINVRKI